MSKIYRNCTACSHQFYISEKDQIFFTNRCTCGHDKKDHDSEFEPVCAGHEDDTVDCSCIAFVCLTFPKRCFTCRQKSKLVAQEEISRDEAKSAQLVNATQFQANPNGGVVEFFVEDSKPKVDWTEKYQPPPRTTTRRGGRR